MPKKKTNPFWAFLMEFKRENKIATNEEAMEKADVVWRSMTDAEKKMYAGRKGNNHQKSQDAPMTDAERKSNEEALFQQTMIEEISSELAIAKKYNNLPRYEFFIIHINSFIFDKQQLMYYPCEIGICSFTLEYGVSENDIYHSYVYPGPLPPGYPGEAKIISEQTHQLPWDYDGMDNQEQVFNEVVNYLSERSRGSDKLPILYAIKERDLETVKNVLERWCEMFDPRIEFTIYNALTLFSLLVKNTVKNSQWTPEAISYGEFQKDRHQYAPGIACEYHGSSEYPIHCSRSIAIRHGYIICENCSPALGISLIPGDHVPDNVIRNRDERRASSKLSDDTGSTVREDSSDAETLVSFGKSSTFNEDTASSIDFPEYDDCRQKINPKGDNLHTTGNKSTSNELNAKTGSSGFSRRPAALPSNSNEVFSNLTESQESNGKRTCVLASLRGRGGAVPKGKGRGHPFRK
ncbi:protein maelstrom 2-like [Coccinella septempunctata]|uniref:protein maelstrom 2-like n=1 Tax=Coccinella septempunctata TaxID=41139 RepID=UPI001D0687B2|nr:protein maelstrom 2-like [Coccinella septempunctata]